MPVPKQAEVLVRIDAVAICATDLEIIYHGPPASIQGGFAFNKNFTPGHEYMGTVVALGPGVDEYRIGQRVTVEIHAGCGQCKRCREGMYTACHNYGLNYGDVDKGHRANGFTTDGGFCEYQVNNINTLVAISGRDVGRGGDAGGHRRHRHVRAHRAGRPGCRRKRRGHRSRPDRAAGRRGREGAGRASGDPHRHPRQPARRSGSSSAPTMSSTSARSRTSSRRSSGSTAARASITWSNARPRPTRSTKRSAWSIAAARSASRRSRTRSAGRYRPHRAQQHLRLRHPRRRQERDPSRRSLHEAEALRRHQDPHPHLPARRLCRPRSATPRTGSRTPSRWW